ncbi:MAG TPA: hypothetical protein VN132_00490 [Bdellovibrio sp.]|nr:hypothetical protein [Bdellovibrio sp.]
MNFNQATMILAALVLSTSLTAQGQISASQPQSENKADEGKATSQTFEEFLGRSRTQTQDIKFKHLPNDKNILYQKDVPSLSKRQLDGLLKMKGGGASDGGGGGGVACFHTVSEKEAAFANGLLKRSSIDQITEIWLLDFFEPQTDGWAKPLDMLWFTSLHNLNALYGIQDKNQESLNEYGYKQRGAESFQQVLQNAERFYIYGIDRTLKEKYSPSFQAALQEARRLLPFSKWIDSQGPLEEFQDQGSIKVHIPDHCGYVQIAFRSRTEKGWQVEYDRELVEKKFSAFMLAMLRTHEEVYLVGALLKNFQVDWTFYNSEKVRELTQVLFAGSFHNASNEADYCEKYQKFHSLLDNLHFTEGLQDLIHSKEKDFAELGRICIGN